MKKLFIILIMAIAAATYFSHVNTRAEGVCYATDCPDGCGGDGDDGGDSGPDGTGDGGGGGGGSDPDGSGGGGDF